MQPRLTTRVQVCFTSWIGGRRQRVQTVPPPRYACRCSPTKILGCVGRPSRALVVPQFYCPMTQAGAHNIPVAASAINTTSVLPAPPLPYLNHAIQSSRACAWSRYSSSRVWMRPITRRPRGGSAAGHGPGEKARRQAPAGRRRPSARAHRFSPRQWAEDPRRKAQAQCSPLVRGSPARRLPCFWGPPCGNKRCRWALSPRPSPQTRRKCLIIFRTEAWVPALTKCSRR